ncbi:transposase [Brachybacterium sp. J153]|uniref:transposase n=1 Tax=Brachybacterium sp. J153 TaxID=3116488 RepID=UPI003FA52579
MLPDEPHAPRAQLGIDLLRHAAHPLGLKQQRHQTRASSRSPRRTGTSHATPADTAGQHVRGPSRSRRGRDRLHVRPRRPRRVPPAHPRPGRTPRRAADREAAVLPDPRDRQTREDLGKTLRLWKTAILAYFDTDGASIGGAEAINGIIELGRRIARGFRTFEHYRLRRLLITGVLDVAPHSTLKSHINAQASENGTRNGPIAMLSGAFTNASRLHAFLDAIY